MASTIKFEWKYEVTIDGVTHTDSNGASPISITAGDDVHSQVFDVGITTTVKLLDVLTEDISAFTFLVIVSTKANVVIELVTDDGAEVGEMLATFVLAANVPFILATDDSYANYTVNFAGGTLDVIETIRVRNLSTTDTAKVRIFTVK